MHQKTHMLSWSLSRWRVCGIVSLVALTSCAAAYTPPPCTHVASGASRSTGGTGATTIAHPRVRGCGHALAPARFRAGAEEYTAWDAP